MGCHRPSRTVYSRHRTVYCRPNSSLLSKAAPEPTTETTTTAGAVAVLRLVRVWQPVQVNGKNFVPSGGHPRSKLPATKM
jgi:hypothetical protein